MPKYYAYMIAGYYLYFTSKCIVEAFHVHASDKRLSEESSAKFFVGSNGQTTVETRGQLTDRDIRKIQAFILNHYKEMYILWSEYGGGDYYHNV